jgi:DNA-binding MarR family transcriptional regulator
METLTKPRAAADRLLWCPKDSLGYRLKRVMHAWSRRFDQALRPLGLTHLQFVTLGAIDDISQSGEIPSQVRVAEWMHQDTMMMSKILRLLEDRGQIERFAHPDDPRANALALTHVGDDLLRRGKPLVVAAHEAFFGRLSEAERAVFASSLDRLLVDA